MKRASIILMIDGDDVWLSRRASDKSIMPDLLECVGGAQDGNEIAKDVAVREMKEEAGLRLKAERFDFKGVIFVNEWYYSLFFVELKRPETPQHLEPTKRNGWSLWDPHDIELGQCSPALGALLSIFLHERRIKRGGT